MAKKKHSNQDLLNKIVEFSDELTDEYYKNKSVPPLFRTRIAPTYTEMKEAEKYPNPELYVKRFGSWKLAKYLAGVEDFNSLSTDEYIDMLTEKTMFSREFIANLFYGLHKHKTKKKIENNIAGNS